MSSAAVTMSLIATGPRSGGCCRRHREERAHDARAALGGRADLHRRDLRRAVAPLFEQHGARHHDGERIVELVRDAGQQRAERRELLALVGRLALARELRGRALVLGDVARDRQHVRLALVLHRDAVHFELEHRAVLARFRELQRSGWPAATTRRKSGATTARPPAGRHRRELALVVAVHPPQRRVGVDDPAVARPTTPVRRSTR